MLSVLKGIPYEAQACPETFKPPKTQAPGNVGSGPSIHPVDSNDSIMVGNPQHGIYVSRASMEKIPRKEAKNYALKLFQLLFSREEAETCSVEGKGDMLKKLNPNRMNALRESTKTQFLANQSNGQKLRLPSIANVEK
ncbi:hypothetical protein ACROYT_G014354 [Oculina patagonica]